MKQQEILGEIKKIIYGKDEVIIMVLTAMIAGGHVLIEDVPGVGKTTMALAFSKALGLDYGRVQFTPDVLPSDITGFTLYDKDTGEMKYQMGNVFHNIFLADELNRASSRTQSALLEAMEEGQVTVDGKTYKLPEPFFVFATQNPSGAAGTSLLPDSQMDRFTVRISMGYPSVKSEIAMLGARNSEKSKTVNQICTAEEFKKMCEEASGIYMSTSILEYIVNLINETRTNPLIDRGASPRATIALAEMAKAHAYVHGKEFVTPDDVLNVFDKVIAHRIILSPEADIRGVRVDEVVKEVVSRVAKPKV